MNKIKFLKHAFFIAENYSKDPSTKVGCLIVSKNGDGKVWGYNGAPRKSKADEDQRSERPEKYRWFEHAERNAIYNAARQGISTLNSVAFITHPPCIDCARALIQAGITEVYCASGNKDFLYRYINDFKYVIDMFEECGVLFECYSLDDLLLKESLSPVFLY